MTIEDNHIDNERARSFVAALRSFEQDGEPSGLVDQFGDGATLWRLDARGDRTDAEAFWREYRAQFGHVSTTFVNAVESDRQVALEWTSDVTSPDGNPFTYSGVTVLDIEENGDRVSALRTYYDSAAILRGPQPQT